MTGPAKSGAELASEIESTHGPGVTLWWLGQCGFAIKSFDIIFYVDPYLTDGAPLAAKQVSHADLILCTHKGRTHMNAETLVPMMEASHRARVVMPKSAADHAASLGLPYSRMTTTDSDLRVEYFKGGMYGRVYSVPSAHPELNWTPLGGYPCLGYLIRFGGVTIYHAGDGRSYEGIADRLRPYNVSVALLPINGGPNFDCTEAAQLAEDIGARWLVPMHYGAEIDRFVNHMLGFRPTIGFKVFQPGECWKVPD
jgi:L-ascorbate metabolism protein UlaG (beta-lactamase superfamily)